MASSMSGSSSSNCESDGQLVCADIEHHGGRVKARQRRLAVRLGSIFPQLRRKHLAFNLLLTVACLTTSLCVVEFVYITHLNKGLVRVENDSYDIRFGRELNRNSPAVWDSYRQTFIHNALPVPVHSHNDYWRRIPLFEALGSGCISIEADIHYRGSDLFVGHSSKDLDSGSTLRSMYLEPLQRMLEAQNTNLSNDSWRGVFNLAPQQTLVLLVDHKTSEPETFTILHTQLQPLRDLDYLTYWNGTDRIMRPLTIVASGSVLFESITALDSKHRDIFWDAKLERLVHGDDNFDVKPVRYAYNISNSYFASTEWRNAILWPYYRFMNGSGSSSPPESPRLRDIGASQIEQAKARGLLSRYWGTPLHPPNMREIVWRVLIEQGVDILNMDDMGIVRARANGWGKQMPHVCSQGNQDVMANV